MAGSARKTPLRDVRRPVSKGRLPRPAKAAARRRESRRAGRMVRGKGATAASPVEHPRRYRQRLAGLLLVLLTLIAYLPVLDAGFIWDDDDYVVENRHLRDTAGLQAIWLEPGATPQYYPLVHTTFWVEHQLWGLNPFGYHLTNVLLHALGGVLLWRVLVSLSIPGAWVGAALFALHPVHVESVAWVTERKNVLSGALFLAALLAYHRFRPGWRDDARGSRVGYGLSLAAFAGALLAKTVTATLPAVILVLLWYRGERLRWASVRPLIPMFVLGAAMSAVTVFMEATRVGAQGPDWDFTLPERVLIAGRALWFYLGKLAWPDPLMFVYPRWTLDATSLGAWLFPALWVATALVALVARHRLGRGPLTTMLLFAGMLFPALGFIDVYPMIFSFVADHFQYLASTAPLALFAGIATVGARRLTTARPSWRHVGPVAAALLLLVLGAATWRQTAIYQDLETLWRDTLAKNPDAWLAHNNLGMLLYERGDATAAEARFRDAIRVKPTYAPARYNLGLVLVEQGRHRDAESAFGDAIRLDPSHARAHNNLGTLLVGQGRMDAATEHFQAAAQAEPAYALAHANLGDALLRRGRVAEAVASLRRALQLDPNDRPAMRQLARALRRTGDGDGAALLWRSLLQHDADDVVALDSLARFLLDQAGVGGTESRDEALVLAARACRLTDHANPALLSTLARAHAATGEIQPALAVLDRAILLAASPPRPQLLTLLRAQRAALAPPAVTIDDEP